jgi:hypothetical protein
MEKQDLTTIFCHDSLVDISAFVDGLSTLPEDTTPMIHDAFENDDFWLISQLSPTQTARTGLPLSWSIDSDALNCRMTIDDSRSPNDQQDSVVGGMFRSIHAHIQGRTNNQELLPEEQEEESFQLSTEIERPLSLKMIRGCPNRYSSHSTRKMLSQLHTISAQPLQEFRSSQTLPMKETLPTQKTTNLISPKSTVSVNCNYKEEKNSESPSTNAITAMMISCPSSATTASTTFSQELIYASISDGVMSIGDPPSLVTQPFSFVGEMCQGKRMHTQGYSHSNTQRHDPNEQVATYQSLPLESSFSMGTDKHSLESLHFQAEAFWSSRNLPVKEAIPVQKTLISISAKAIVPVKTQLKKEASAALHSNQQLNVQPIRPITAYNFFFSYERKRIWCLDSAVNYKAGTPPNDFPSSNLKNDDLDHYKEDWWNQPASVVILQKTLLQEHWQRDRSQKRKHRKTHQGAISFQDLARQISQTWHFLPLRIKNVFRAIADEDSMRYYYDIRRLKLKSKSNDRSVRWTK